ncbi:glycosyltransferase family 2 protein, partial [Campylobacter jejuni]
MSKISIILPTYNVEQYIARAIESCINQTFKNIEIIVVDDCGSDKS